MANFKEYFGSLLQKEGGYVDHPRDRGGATNLGITMRTWVQSGYDKDGDGDVDKYDLQKITKDDAEKIAKTLYWDKIRGDYIRSQSVAELIFDWAYNSGVFRAVQKVQEALNQRPDGFMGPLTLGAINMQPSRSLFELLKMRREKFYKDIVFYDPSQRVFLKGWLKRLDEIKFKR